MDEKKFQALMENEEFVEELLSKEEPEDVQKLFADNGVEMSIDEIKGLGILIEKVIDGEIDAEKLLSLTKGEITEGDLSDDALKEVSGGNILPDNIIAQGLEKMTASQAGETTGKVVGTMAQTVVGIPLAIGVTVATAIPKGVVSIGRGIASTARSIGRAFRRW